jgi:hypothetical protein
MIRKYTFLALMLNFSFQSWAQDLLPKPAVAVKGNTLPAKPANKQVASRTEVKTSKPYKIIIVTDSEAYPRASEFKDYLITKPPFSRMGDSLQIELVSMEAKKMNCKNDNPSSPRIITCDRDLIYKTQSEHNAHLSLAFTSKGSGGAGGDIPVASMDYPIQTMFHEMLHTYGLDDEYDYSESEQSVYCNGPVSSANIVYFKDIPPYNSDSLARSKHSGVVHWMGQIPVEQLITSGSDLGSQSLIKINIGNQPLGLFRGGSCNNKTLPGWRPYQSSIMEGYVDDTIYPIYEEAIIRNIESAVGRKSTLPPAESRCVHTQSNIQVVNNLGSEIDSIVKKIPHPHNHKH